MSEKDYGFLDDNIPFPSLEEIEEDDDGFNEAKKKAIREFFELDVRTEFGDRLINNLNEAAYTMSEMNMWPDDIDSISVGQIIACWKVIEKLRKTNFPVKLKM